MKCARHMERAATLIISADLLSVESHAKLTHSLSVLSRCFSSCRFHCRFSSLRASYTAIPHVAPIAASRLPPLSWQCTFLRFPRLFSSHSSLRFSTTFFLHQLLFDSYLSTKNLTQSTDARLLVSLDDSARRYLSPFSFLHSVRLVNLIDCCIAAILILAKFAEIILAGII